MGYGSYLSRCKAALTFKAFRFCKLCQTPCPIFFLFCRKFAYGILGFDRELIFVRVAEGHAADYVFTYKSRLLFKKTYSLCGGALSALGNSRQVGIGNLLPAGSPPADCLSGHCKVTVCLRYVRKHLINLFRRIIQYSQNIQNVSGAGHGNI